MSDILRLMHNICPYRIGSRVKVKPEHKYAAEWNGTYIVVMISWNYQDRDGDGINIGIISQEELLARYGWSDGWSPDDLLPA